MNIEVATRTLGPSDYVDIERVPVIRQTVARMKEKLRALSHIERDDRARQIGDVGRHRGGRVECGSEVVVLHAVPQQNGPRVVARLAAQQAFRRHDDQVGTAQ